MNRELLGVLVVSQKPISQKMSWTTHDSAKGADRQIASSLGARSVGRHQRRLYRVNVYPNLERHLCGPSGRVT